MTKKGAKLSTHRLTCGFGLVDVPGLSEQHQNCWKVKFLGIKEKTGGINSPIKKEFLRWEKQEKADFRKILRSIIYVGTHEKHLNENCVKEDIRGRDVFEIKAKHCRARIMFFYLKDKKYVICTNHHWKKYHLYKQDSDFDRCSKLKKMYLEQ